MSQSANVKSIGAIHDFKICLANFAEEARTALSSSDMEVRRARNWLTRDQLSYWQAQVKRRNEEVSTARTELHRRKLSQQGSEAVSDADQKEALRMAQRRLEEAERKVALCKKWAPVLEHAISEYRAATQPLGDRLSGQLVNSMMLLDRMVATLESYIAVAPPPRISMPEPSSDRSESVGSSATSAAPAAAAAAPAETATAPAASAEATPAVSETPEPVTVGEPTP
jgi:hypothetical protein